MPLVIRYMKLYALGVFALGALLLYSVFFGEPSGA